MSINNHSNDEDKVSRWQNTPCINLKNNIKSYLRNGQLNRLFHTENQQHRT